MSESTALRTAIQMPGEACRADGRCQLSFRRGVLAVFAFSLVVRVAWASFAHFSTVSDFAYYQGLAERLLRDGSYQYLTRQAWVPPAYPLFLAGTYAVLGNAGLVCSLAQAVLGAVSSVLMVLLASRVFSGRVALWAGLLHAVAPSMIVYVPAQASENLAIPLMLALLLVIDFARQSDGWKGLRYAAMGGLLCGLLLLTRSAMLFMVPACGFLLLASCRWSLAKPAAFSAFIGLALIPWIVRNYRVGLGFMPFTSVGGAGLYIANSDESLNGEWGDVSHGFVEGMNEKDRSRAYGEEGRKWIRQHFRRYLALCRVRLSRLLGSEPDDWAARLLTPTYQNDKALAAEFHDAWEQTPAPPELRARAQAVAARNRQVLFWLNVLFLSPVAFIALALGIRRWRETALLTLPLVAYLAGLVLTIASMRYRLMSDPLLLILIAALLCDLFTGSRELGGRPGRFAKIGLTGAAVLVSVGAHTSAWADDLYRLDALPVRNPSVAHLEFRRADLGQAYASWVERTRTQVTRQNDGLHCTVSGTTETSAAQYGGIQLPADGCEAVRLDISLVDPEGIIDVFVDLSDSSGNRLTRWQWIVAGKVEPSERRGTYVFVPGKPVGRFFPEKREMKGIPAVIHVFLQVYPRRSAGFIVHQVELGGPAAAVPKLQFTPADLGRATSSWIVRTQTRVSVEGDGLRCLVSGSGDTAGAQYGGVSLPIDPCQAVRLKLSLLNPPHVHRVFVNFMDGQGSRLARWQWDVMGRAETSNREGTYVFEPGRTAGWFVPEPPLAGTPTMVQVFIEVLPNTEAGFALRTAEAGRRSELPNHRFVPVALGLGRPSPTWVLRTQTDITQGAEGLNCRVAGTADTSAAQYGGISLPIDPCEAVRMQVSFRNSRQILSVFVDLTSASGERLARWQWRPASDSRGIYVLVPGQPVGHIAMETRRLAVAPATIHVFLEVSPATEAGFTLHQLETGRLPEVSSRPSHER